MKILDSTAVIAIFNEIKCPELVDKILELGHDLAIPYYVRKNELLDKNTSRGVQGFIIEGKIKALKKNSIEKIQEFREKYPESVVSLDKCDTMPSYENLRGSGGRIYRILDDKDARALASILKIEHVGLVGVLKKLKDKKIMTHSEIDDVIVKLKRSKFRFPKGVDVWVCAKNW